MNGEIFQEAASPLLNVKSVINVAEDEKIGSNVANFTFTF